MRWTRCPFEIEMRPVEVDEIDKMADAKCLRLEIPADGVDKIDKMQDGNEQMRWKYGG